MRARLAGLVACLLVPISATAFELVADINVVRWSDSGFIWGLSTADVSSGTLFSMQDDARGAELWISDGTVNGTRLVRDIRPGPNDSSVSRLTAVGGVAFFVADDGVNGRELWRSDGSAAGTRLVANIGDGAGAGPSSNSDPIVSAGGVLFFAAQNAATGLELWRSDGTAAGTFRLTDSMSGPSNGDPADLIAVGARVFFTANDTAGRELWVSDGTTAGTRRVADIRPGAASPGIDQMVAAGGALFFSADNGQLGVELWRASGDGAAVAMISDLNTNVSGTGTASAFPSGIAALGDGVVFVATVGSGASVRHDLLRATAGGNAVVTLAAAPGPGTLRRFTAAGSGALFAFAPTANGDGSEVWITDGTAANTRVLGLGNLNFSSGFHAVTRDGNETFFFARSDGNPNYDLWRTDGSAAGTRLYAALNVAAPMSAMVRAGARLYFVSGTTGQGSGSELWSSDGTPAGTSLVRDIAPGTASSDPQYLQRVANSVVFNAYDDRGRSAWLSTGVSAGTARLDNLTGVTVTFGAEPQLLGAIGNQLYLAADDGIRGSELWVTDGTPAGTRLVRDLTPGIQGSFPRGFHSLGNGVAVFLSTAASSSLSGTLWRTDGTLNGTYAIADFYSQSSTIDTERSTVLNGAVYFTRQGINGDELWRSDGTIAGTYQIVPPGGGPSNSLQVFKATAGGRVLFSAHMTTHMDLWFTDGTSAGTVKAHDTLSVFPGFWSVEFQGRACFEGKLGFTGNSEIWCTDGTANGFAAITNMAGLGAIAMGRPVVVNGRVLFNGALHQSVDGGVYATDGTPASTRRLTVRRMDVANPPPLLGNGTRLVYFANGETMHTDGTEAGTRAFFQGPTFAIDEIKAHVGFGDRLIYRRSTWPNGGAFWVSDGTTAGTRLLADPNIGVEAFPEGGQLRVMGSRVYFTAEGRSVGTELWSMSASIPNANDDLAAAANNTATTINVLGNDSDLDSSLSPASVQIVTAPTSGSTTIDLSNGAVTYTPNAGFSGVDRFTYRVSDPQANVSNVAEVEVVIAAAVATATGAEPAPTPPAPPPTPTPTPTPPANPPSQGGGGGGGGALGLELFALLLVMMGSRLGNRGRYHGAGL